MSRVVCYVMCFVPVIHSGSSDSCSLRWSYHILCSSWLSCQESRTMCGIQTAQRHRSRIRPKGHRKPPFPGARKLISNFSSYSNLWAWSHTLPCINYRFRCRRIRARYHCSRICHSDRVSYIELDKTVVDPGELFKYSSEPSGQIFLKNILTT